MKRIILTTLTCLFFAINNFAQAPQKMTYQAVIRNASNTLLSNTSVGIQISILTGSPTGSAAYIERHNVTTNANGLATLVIGNGTPVAGSLTSIDWSTGSYFIKSETDPSGGTTYSITGTSQLLSVPYALYAEQAGGGATFSGDYNDLTNTPTTVSSFTNDAGYITSPNDADANPTNEIQTLSLVGQTLSISGGNNITLPTASGVTLDGAYDQGGAGAGRIITADSGPVQINGSGSNTAALGIQFTGTGNSVNAANTNAGNQFAVIQGVTNSSTQNNSAVFGQSTGAARAVSGEATAASTVDVAVRGNNLRTTGGIGVEGVGFNGVSGQTNYSSGNASYSENFDAIAPLGNGVGAAGKGYYGVVGEDRYLGTVAGAYGVLANGDLGATGTKTFVIDHPSDPENKLLRHFSTESNEVLNIYRGNILLDENGEAVVELPDYYDQINMNPSYHLTPIGGFAQLYIKEEIAEGHFIIAGGSPGMKVSWTIYAERNDPYLQMYPEKRAVELEKREGQKGKYFMPQLYNASPDKKQFQSLENGTVEQQPQPELK